MRRNMIGYFLAFGLLIVFWHLGSLALNKSFLPTPLASFQAFVIAFSEKELLYHWRISALRIVISILLAFVTAMPLGLFMGRSPKADRILGPLVYLLYPLPKVVFLPIIVVLLGLGSAPKIFLIALVIFFQIIVVTRDAARSIPNDSILSMRSLNATPMSMYYHLILPYCLPKILTSLRVTLGTAVAILFFAETFASFDGLGYFILEGMETRNYPDMYAGIIALALLGMMLYWLVDYLEYCLCRWQKYENS